MLVVSVTYDATIDAATWAIVPGGTAHGVLATVDQPGSESSYVEAVGLADGVLKLSLPPGPADINRLDEVGHEPILVLGINTGNFPILRARLVVGGVVKHDKSFEVDSAGDFFLASFKATNLGINGVTWRASTRQVWFSVNSSTVREEPIPEFG